METRLQRSGASLDGLDRCLRRSGLATRRHETSRAWLLRSGQGLYKVWKPRPGEGLQPPEARRLFCEEDVRLNQRLAGHCRHQAVALFDADDTAAGGACGQPLDWAVAVQHRAPVDLGSLCLAQGTLEAHHVSRLADFVAQFHREAALARAGMGVGETAPPTPPAGREPAGTAAGESVARWLGGQARMLAQRFSERLAGGHVREGHGDLRLDHVAVRQDDARVFTGIEHDPAQRWIDVLADAGGIVVDLMVHGRRDLAFVFLNRYLALSGDYAGLDLLRYYLVRCAAARGLELARSGARADGGGSVTPADYTALALRLAQGANPRLLITCGAPGSGKSYAAQLLLVRAGAICVNWETERQRLFSRSARACARSAGPGVLDGASMSLLIQDRLRKLAISALAAGFPTIIDGAFLYRWQRDGLQAVASALGVPFTILDFQSAEPALPAQQLQAGEPLGEHERRRAVVIGRGQPLSPATLAAGWMRAAPMRLQASHFQAS